MTGSTKGCLRGGASMNMTWGKLKSGRKRLPRVLSSDGEKATGARPRTRGLCESHATDGSLSPPAAGHPFRTEPSEVSLSPRGCQPESGHPVPDCGPCRAPGAVLMYGNSRARRRIASDLSVPSSPLPLAETNDHGRFLIDNDL